MNFIRVAGLFFALCWFGMIASIHAADNESLDGVSNAVLVTGASSGITNIQGIRIDVTV